MTEEKEKELAEAFRSLNDSVEFTGEPVDGHRWFYNGKWHCHPPRPGDKLDVFGIPDSQRRTDV